MKAAPVLFLPAVQGTSRTDCRYFLYMWRTVTEQKCLDTAPECVGQTQQPLRGLIASSPSLKLHFKIFHPSLGAQQDGNDPQQAGAGHSLVKQWDTSLSLLPIPRLIRKFFLMFKPNSPFCNFFPYSLLNSSPQLAVTAFQYLQSILSPQSNLSAKSNSGESYYWQDNMPERLPATFSH